MKRLAIVADRTSMVDTFRLALRQTTGFKLAAVADGRHSLPGRLHDADPDVVLVDDMHDRGNSLQRIREIRAELPNAHVVFLTSEMDPNRTAEALDAGAHAIISKLIHPVSLATLLRETANGNIVHSTAGMSIRSREAVKPSLTARELEILRLAAEGHTNDQIARMLWVTEKTVKFHLGNTYRKLGVSNRTEASHYAHTNDLLRERQRIAS
jgi:DNA-binding NarL/FixJ family response regulator